MPASWVGSPLTLIVKSILQVASAVAGGVRTTGVVGVNVTCPVLESTPLIVNVVPAQAVPASPVPVGGEGTVKTPGSASAVGQSPVPTVGVVAPQAGTRLSSVSVTLPVLCVAVEALVTWIEAANPV